jgi:hypothetical protein
LTLGRGCAKVQEPYWAIEGDGMVTAVRKVHNEPNRLEAARIEMGLSIKLFLDLIGAKVGRWRMLELPDEEADPAFVERAEVLLESYRAWRRGLERRLAEYEEDGKESLNSRELEELFGITDTLLVAWRRRGWVIGKDTGPITGILYPLKEVRRLIHDNSQALQPGKRVARHYNRIKAEAGGWTKTGRYKGLLSTAFVRWLEKARPGRVDTKWWWTGIDREAKEEFGEDGV